MGRQLIFLLVYERALLSSRMRGLCGGVVIGKREEGEMDDVPDGERVSWISIVF